MNASKIDDERMWESKFKKFKPVDHIKGNIDMFYSLTPGPDDRATARKTFKIKDYQRSQLEKLESERIKIRNIIGNNPFRVRNYVQGDDLDNDLVPLKLLKPKDEKFDNDEEFIEHFLKKKKREEKAKAELEMRKKK